MKLPRLLFIIAALVSSAIAQTAGVTKSVAPASLNEITGDLIFPSARSLTLNGTLAGTPTGGTLNLSGLTLTLPTSFTWAGVLSGANGGTGVANSGKTITLGGNLATSGAFGLTLTLTGATTVTLPTSGTLATLAGTETLTNKTLTSPVLTTPNIGAATGTSVNLSGNGTFGGNLTVSGTGVSSVAGTLNVTGSLLAHQTAALNMAHEGSSLSQLVSYGADASTYGRLNVTLRKAGTGVGAVTALALTSTDATFGGNLTTGSNSTISASAGYLLIQPTTTLYLRATSGSVAIADAGSGAVSLGQPGSTTTVQGNLTVSGGTITGGTSGMSLASGGTNQNITLTPSGTGRSNAYGSIPSSAWSGASDADASFNAGLVVGPRGTGSSFGVSTASASGAYPSGLLIDGSYTAFASTVNIKAVGVYSGGGYGASLAFHTSNNTTLSEVGRFTKAGNLLLGTTTDGGYKLLVSGDGYFASTLTLGSGLLRLGTAFHYISGGNGVKTIIAGSSNGVEIQALSNFTVANTSASTSTTTGALVVSGGVGVAGAVNAGGNVTAADVLLGGTSGPSVKSSLSARAPRQGLVFDGTAGATGNIPALGTGNFTYSVWFNLAATDASNDQPFWGSVNSAAFGVKFNTQRVVVWKPGVGYNAVNSTDVSVGKWVMATYTRSGTTGTYYINGVADGTITDSFDYTAATTAFGSNKVSNGTAISGCLVYNRALSASEVVALYESGAPAGADYNSASNTSLITGDNSTFASDTGYWTKSGSVTIGGGNATFSAGGAFLRRDILTGGKRFRLTVVITANTAADGLIIYNGGANLATYNTTGTKVLEIAASTAASPANSLYLYQAGAGGVTVDTVTLEPLGLLLAPDAAQAGNGFVWSDKSGNGAHIVVPTSGVSWNLPGDGATRVRGTTNTNGNQQLLGATTLAANSQIVRARARSRSGTPTIALGTASGGSQIVASTAMSTTWKDLTIALTGGIVSSNSSVWVNSNSTDVVEIDLTTEPLSP